MECVRIKLVAPPLYDTSSLLKQPPCCQKKYCRNPNNETSSLCCWIHVCSPTAFLSVGLLYFLFTGGFPNLTVNSFVCPWMCNSSQFLQWWHQTMTSTQHTHTNHHEHSEVQPISGRICSSIIVGNNTTAGTNRYSILRPVVKVANTVFFFYQMLEKKRKRQQESVTFNQW